MSNLVAPGQVYEYVHDGSVYVVLHEVPSALCTWNLLCLAFERYPEQVGTADEYVISPHDSYWRRLA